MTRLTAVFHAVLLVAFASALVACGRSDLGVGSGGAGGASSGCTKNTDCPAGETCDLATGQCVPPGGGCTSDADCSSPTPHCRLDDHTCVQCTVSSQCPNGEVCDNFQCVGFCGGGGTCTNGLTCCSPLCVDEATNPSDCGACGNVCGPYPNATPACTAMTCGIAKCAPGFADCDKLPSNGCEVDTGADPANCGACGKACPAGDSCSGGVCVGGCGPGSTCPAGQVCCGASCENTVSDPNNCGACGKVCGQVADASVTCSASACAIAACSKGFGDCNHVESDGCEVNLETDPANCGGCGSPCAAGETCTGGLCAGGCGPNAPCANGLTCCGVTCDNTTGDLNNCGGCGNVCPQLPDATPDCSASACVIGSCTSGFADCNKKVPDGCEIDTNTDPANCGSCGHACPGGAGCTAGICQPASCKVTGCPGTQTCCGTTCIDTTSSLANCGGCGNACPPGANLCQAGGCCFPQGGGEVCMGIVCSPPLSACNNTCVNENIDPANCGGCGNLCQPGQMCVGAMCIGQNGCNGGPACTGTQQCCQTGCSDTTTDPNNCGGCNQACPPGAACVANMCQQPATCNGGPTCSPTQKCCASGCSDTTSDAANCGACSVACPAGDTCVNSACKQGATCNGGPACTGTQTCCAAGCVDTNSDPNNCGKCMTVCGPPSTCTDGMCAVNEGAFDPMVNPTYLSPGVHNFTTITIPAGVTVYVAGPGAASGTLDLHATGDIVIDGTIDLSGGPGTQNTITSQSTNSGRAGSGGYTGEPYQSAVGSSACKFIAGNPGQLGFAVQGTPGSCTVLSTTVCVDQNDPTALLFTAPPAAFGGGAGIFTGYRAYGSGGGGLAGGAPGALGAAYPGEMDCAGASGGGGAINGLGGVASGAPYDGLPGASGQTQCPGLMPPVPPAYVGGGGGGSIGLTAANDLAVLTTFMTGSGGGGGSADYLNRPVFGGTSGGGGGGGALKLSTPGTITINGQLLANGGIGGDADIGNGMNANCDPQPGAAGGGGSGGLIYLSAPSINVSASGILSAVGGAGGAGSEFATGGAGGTGGLGRIRLSVTPATCALSGMFSPPLSSGCLAAAAKAGFAYLGSYPN